MIETRAFFPKSTVAEILTQAIDSCTKSQKEIAQEAGFNKPNIITMLKQGATPLPINRVGPLAKAVGLDPAFLLKLMMQEYYPESWAAIEENLGAPVLTEHERELIGRWRYITNDTDPPFALLKDIGSLAKIALIVPLDIG